MAIKARVPKGMTAKQAKEDVVGMASPVGVARMAGRAGRNLAPVAAAGARKAYRYIDRTVSRAVRTSPARHAYEMERKISRNPALREAFRKAPSKSVAK